MSDGSPTVIAKGAGSLILSIFFTHLDAPVARHGPFRYRAKDPSAQRAPREEETCSNQH